LNKPIHIGRDSDNFIVLAEPQIGRHHATLILLTENTFLIEDNNSTNGTYVNKIHVKRMVCTREDTIEFADIPFQLNNYFPVQQVKSAVQENFKEELKKELNIQAPEVKPAAPVNTGRADTNDFSEDFFALKLVYEQYNDVKLKLQRDQMVKVNFFRGIPAALGQWGGQLLAPLIIGAVGVAIPGLGLAIGFLGSIAGLIASNRVSNSEKVFAIDEEFKIFYCCPKCKTSLGSLPWAHWAQKKNCPWCKVIWIKE